MSFGVGTQFTASLSPGQTQTWFTYAWDPNYLVIWSIRPTTLAAQVRLDEVSIEYGELGFTYWLTITNSGSSAATFEARYYFKTVIPEANWRNLGPDHLSGCMIQVAIDPNNSDRLFGVAQGGRALEARQRPELPGRELDSAQRPSCISRRLRGGDCPIQQLNRLFG